MREVVPGIFMESVGVPQWGIEPANLYIVRGGERSLLVDAGFATEDARLAIECLMRQVGARFDTLDVFITHCHADHAGLAGWLQQRGARILADSRDRQYRLEFLASSGEDARQATGRLRMLGLTDERWALEQFERQRDGEFLRLYSIEPFTSEETRPGDRLSYGDYSFCVAALPGHTRFHQGLFDESRRLLFCGDQLTPGAAPGVAAVIPGQELLEQYFAFLARAEADYAGCSLLPGHGGVLRNGPEDLALIRRHYEKKCAQVCKALRDRGGRMTTVEVAQAVYARTCEEMVGTGIPFFVMVVGKVFACLEYLCGTGEAVRKERDGVFYWSAV